MSGDPPTGWSPETHLHVNWDPIPYDSGKARVPYYLDLMDARETNKRLNRRLQQLEGPFEAKLARVQARADSWMGQWQYGNEIRRQQENQIIVQWIAILSLAVALTVAILWR